MPKSLQKEVHSTNLLPLIDLWGYPYNLPKVLQLLEYQRSQGLPTPKNVLMLFIDYQLKTNFDSCLAVGAQLKLELDDRRGATNRTRRDRRGP